MNVTKWRAIGTISWVAAIAASIILVACGKDADRASTNASAKPFPGYQQVGGSGDAAQLWFNPTDIPGEVAPGNTHRSDIAHRE